MALYDILRDQETVTKQLISVSKAKVKALDEQIEQLERVRKIEKRVLEDYETTLTEMQNLFTEWYGD